MTSTIIIVVLVIDISCVACAMILVMLRTMQPQYGLIWSQTQVACARMDCY